MWILLDLWTGGIYSEVGGNVFSAFTFAWPVEVRLMASWQKTKKDSHHIFSIPPHLPFPFSFLSFCPWLALKCGFNCLWPEGFSKCQFSEFASTWNSCACKPWLFNSNAQSFIKLNKYLNKKPNLPHCNNRPCPNWREQEAYSGFIFLINLLHS